MELDHRPCVTLGEDDVYECASLARIVAVHWNLVPWALVLDLDARLSDEVGTEVRRMWLVFQGVFDLTLPLERANVPAGIWIVGPMWSAGGDADGVRDFTLPIQADTIDLEGVPAGSPNRDLRVRARSVFAVASVATAAEEKPHLSFRTRSGLADDLSMLAAAEQSPYFEAVG